MDNDYGYGQIDDVVKETQKSNSRYLQFKGDEKQSIQIRIASEPRVVIRHWANGKPLPHENGDDCQYCGKQLKDSEKMDKVAQWGWVVLDRGDNDAVKIFKGPNSVALAIRDLSKLVSKKTGQPIYGNPLTFDVIITRWKKDNGFFEYSVEGDPESRGEMTPTEKQAVAEADYDLTKELAGSRESKHVGNYKTDLETAPDDTVKPEDIPANLGEGGESDDDIPF